MRLQIKKLEGPDELRMGIRTGLTHTGTLSAETAMNKFTCYLNRDVEAGDAFPIRVHIDIYDEQGTVQYRPVILDVNRNNIYDNNHFCFILSPNSTLALSGSYIRLQALLKNRVDGTAYISVSNRKTNETIKKVLLYTEKTIRHVYWSNNEVIDINRLDEEENPRTGTIGQNEDAFLHIKTLGMCNESVQVTLTAGEYTLKLEEVRLNQNRKTVAYSMADVIAKYRTLSGNPSGAVNISLRATVSYWVGNISNTGEFVRPKSTEAALNIELKDRNPASKRGTTGTVYVRVNPGEPERVTPDGYTDFELGYVAHLLSTGRIDKGIGGTWSLGGVARYPFRFYKLWLSDLVECGVVTPQDARTLTLDNKTKSLKSPQTMESSFNKYQAFAGRSMIQRVASGDRIDTNIIVKVLKYVSREGGRGIFETKEVCRDAWQTQGKAKGVTPNNRYAYNGSECPHGGYTINFFGPTYEVYFSNSIAEQSTNIFQPERTRQGLAIHRGDAYFATGCTTLYCPSIGNIDRTSGETEGRRVQYNFLEFLFKTRSLADRKTPDRKRLILAYIEERSAQQSQRYNNRWYDIIAPEGFASSITGPTTIASGETANYTFVLNKRSMAMGDSITSEEKRSIRWQINTGGRFRDLPEANGLTAISIDIEDGWAGKTIIVKAYVSLSFNNLDNTSKQTTVTKKKT